MTRRVARNVLALASALAAALVVASSALAHAELSPSVALVKATQLYTLAVPTEEENAFTTQIELTPPSGFSIDSFAPAPGWRRTVAQVGSGEDAVVQRVTWAGGRVPSGEDSLFQFLATPAASTTYTFAVRQTYSNGKVVDWTGSESSDTPAPTVEAKSSLGGGASTLAIVALVVAGVALVLALVALIVRGGGRALA